MKENKIFKRLVIFAIAATMCLTALAIMPSSVAATTILTEGFEGYIPPVVTFPPIDPMWGPWTIVDGSSDGETWQSGLVPEYDMTMNSAEYAVCDSDAYYPHTFPMVEDLIAPAVPGPSPGFPFMVEFDYYLKSYSGATLDVYISPSGAPGSWIWVGPTITSSSGKVEGHWAVDIAPIATGWPMVYVSWTYNDYGVWDYQGAIDTVIIQDLAGPPHIVETFDATPASGWPPAGWTHQVVTGTDPDNEWEVQSVETTYPNVVTPHGGTYMAEYGAYWIYSGNSARLYTPSMNFAAVGDPVYKLRFWMWHDTYGYGSDEVVIQGSTDAFTWADLDTFVRDDGTSGWVQHEVDLTTYAPYSTVYVGFLGDSDYGYSLHIDDIEIISESVIHDVGVTSIDYPPSGIIPTFPFEVEATVHNFGSIGETSVPVECFIYDYPQTLFFDDMDGSRPSEGLVNVNVVDENFKTDEPKILGTEIEYDNDPSFATWYEGGLWHKQTYRANSAPNSYYCGIDSTHTYPTYLYDWLIGPEIDLQGNTNVNLQFKAWYDTESDFTMWDYLRFGMSPDGYSFYYYGGTELWGNSGGWVTVSIPVHPVMISPSGTIWIAFWFDSDYWDTTDEGVYIDDVELVTTSGLVFYDLQYVDVGSGSDEAVTFAPFTPDPGTMYDIYACTNLMGDADPTNDCDAVFGVDASGVCLNVQKAQWYASVQNALNDLQSVHNDLWVIAGTCTENVVIPPGADVTLEPYPTRGPVLWSVPLGTYAIVCDLGGYTGTTNIEITGFDFEFGTTDAGVHGAAIKIVKARDGPLYLDIHHNTFLGLTDTLVAQDTDNSMWLCHNRFAARNSPGVPGPVQIHDNIDQSTGGLCMSNCQAFDVYDNEFDGCTYALYIAYGCPEDTTIGDHHIFDNLFKDTDPLVFGDPARDAPAIDIQYYGSGTGMTFLPSVIDDNVFEYCAIGVRYIADTDMTYPADLINFNHFIYDCPEPNTPNTAIKIVGDYAPEIDCTMNWYGQDNGPGGNIIDPVTGKFVNGLGCTVIGPVNCDPWIGIDGDISATPSSVLVGNAIIFDGSGSFAYYADGTPNTILDYEWDLGNGQHQFLESFGYVYDTPGTYKVTLHVRAYDPELDEDNNYLDDEETFYVTVSAAGADLGADADPEIIDGDSGNGYEGTTEEAIQFYGLATGGVPPYTWLWDLGDGTTSTEQNPVHLYTYAGEYMVTLTVTDSEENTATDTTTAYVTGVEDPDDPVKIEDITAGFGLKATVVNPTDEPIDWTISIEGKLVFKGSASGTIEANSDGIINTGLVLGFGNVGITITAGETVEERTAFLLGPFILSLS